MRFKQFLKEQYGTWPWQAGLGVIKPTSPDVRRYSKTGSSGDYLTPIKKKDKTGTANTVDHYYDPLDPRNTKSEKKKKWADREAVAGIGASKI